MTKPFPECHAQPYTGNKIKRNTAASFQYSFPASPLFAPTNPSSSGQLSSIASFLYAAVMAWRTRAPRCLEFSLWSWETGAFSTASSPSVRMSSMWQGHDM